MFVPRHYREPDGSWMSDLIRGNPLALAVTNGGDDGLLATHLPIIPDHGTVIDWSGSPNGTVLLGHLNRANPHWRALRTGDAVLLVFTGPHGYVSPAVYEVTPAAPTWNFTSVHVHGVIERIDSLEETLDVVRATAQTFESSFGSGWDQSESIDYFRSIVSGVGAFRVTVTGAEGMFKLSQEQSPEVRERVEQSFSQRACSRHKEAAELMSRLSRNGQLKRAGGGVE
ncbi:FMN-binding negative transcriptional regulator [Streptomyces alboniger]|uniref:FMN-binding negative transcriptional regulator n=1 Tax=Streptomyces alboniger TaxID=132473 RepID=A0A5J6HG38_STRAD|nr:FMN-binding negative transcriptional regulator [Streptomyces alboniger]QEV16157.1 FMN-binding negative transcriptional regulator [Streptomyces alboniger]